MARKLSVAEKVRRMIDQGYNNKAIVERLGVKPQIVYNMRYQLNRARGLGAIGQTAPVPAEGIGTPPKKRKYTRKVKAGTGINQTPELPLVAEPVIVAPEPPTPVVAPTLWERIKGWFRG